MTVAGIGPGSGETMTGEVCRAIEEADCVIGAERMLSVARPGQSTFAAIKPEVIADYIRNHREFHNFVVVMSGDVGFFSGAKKLLPLLTDCQVEVLPGISSLSYFCARLGRSYEDYRRNSRRIDGYIIFFSERCADRGGKRWCSIPLRLAG